MMNETIRKEVLANRIAKMEVGGEEYEIEKEKISLLVEKS
jgi:hypothetical protein